MEFSYQFGSALLSLQSIYCRVLNVICTWLALFYSSSVIEKHNLNHLADQISWKRAVATLALHFSISKGIFLVIEMHHHFACHQWEAVRRLAKNLACVAAQGMVTSRLVFEWQMEEFLLIFLLEKSKVQLSITESTECFCQQKPDFTQSIRTAASFRQRRLTWPEHFSLQPLQTIKAS